MFTRHLSATQKGISMHSDPNADQLAFNVDGAPTPNDNSIPSASTVTEPSTPPSSSASALDTLLNDIAEIVEVIESVKGDNDAKAH